MAQPRIRKFTPAQIVYHWLYAGAWLVLALTGAAFLWRPDPHSTAVGLGAVLQGSVGQTLRTVHRVAALFFMTAPLVWMVLEPRTFLGELIGLLTLRKTDWQWLAVAPRHYFTGKPPLPPQGKYNAGQKLNEWVVLITYFGFAASGLIMWLGRGAVGAETFRWMLLLHELCFWLGVGMATLHIYLTLLHPFTSQAITVVLNGFVSLRYARAEHPLWVAEQIESGKAEIVDAPAHD